MTRFCPGAIEHQVLGYINHFDQFKNASFGQIAESFMFGILIQSLEMRIITQRISIYDEAGDIAGIVQELVGFLRIVVFFDNVYAIDPIVSGKSATSKIDIDDLSFFDDWIDGESSDLVPPGAPVEAPSVYNMKPYRAVLALASRFADFFSVQSLTYRCAQTLN